METDSPAPFLLEGSRSGVLLLHGFTSTPQSVRYVGHQLHALSGVTVMAPLLAGHGTTPEDFAQTGFRDWLKSAEDALEALSARCTTVCVAGLSLGGTIALNLSIRPGIGSDIKNPGYKETCYDRIPNAVAQERYVLATATGQMLPLLEKPLLILQSRIDHIVSPENGKRIEGAVASRSITFCWLENSYHVATLDNDRDLIVQELTNFLTAE